MKNKNNIFVGLVAVLLLTIVLFTAFKTPSYPPIVYINGTTAPHVEQEGDMKDMVTINLPFLLIPQKYQQNLDAYANDYGYEYAKLTNGGDSVKIKMTAFSHELLLSQIGLQTMKKIGEVMDATTYCEKLAEYYDDFTRIVLEVDQAGYEKDETSSLIPYYLGECCLLYQLYDVNPKNKCEVVIVGAENGKEIFKKTYTQADLKES